MKVEINFNESLHLNFSLFIAQTNILVNNGGVSQIMHKVPLHCPDCNQKCWGNFLTQIK